MARVFIGIGSNVGHREGHLRVAQAELRQLSATRHVALSSTYETDPVGPVDQGKFLNAVAKIETDLPPDPLLTELGRIEATAGREPESQRHHWGPRTLDLDLLLYDERSMKTDRLVVPHPHMHERWFVLKPMCDLAPNALHPTLGVTMQELLETLERQSNGRGVKVTAED